MAGGIAIEGGFGDQDPFESIASRFDRSLYRKLELGLSQSDIDDFFEFAWTVDLDRKLNRATDKVIAWPELLCMSRLLNDLDGRRPINVELDVLVRPRFVNQKATFEQRTLIHHPEIHSGRLNLAGNRLGNSGSCEQ